LKMFPSGKISIGVERALQLVIGRGPVKAVLHIVFAGPKNHDRLACGLGGHLRRFHDEIRLVAAAKSAAHQRGMDDHFFRRQLSGFCNNALRPLRRLRRDPCFSAVGPDLHGAIHRLHASMGSERKLVDRFDLFRTGRQNGVCRAFVADNFSRLGGVREKLFFEALLSIPSPPGLRPISLRERCGPGSRPRNCQREQRFHR